MRGFHRPRRRQQQERYAAFEHALENRDGLVIGIVKIIERQERPLYPRERRQHRGKGCLCVARSFAGVKRCDPRGFRRWDAKRWREEVQAIILHLFRAKRRQRQSMFLLCIWRVTREHGAQKVDCETVGA